MQTYNRKPVSFVKGEGVYLWDNNGKKYIDALCGLAVTSLGHSNELISNVLSKQSKTLIHTSNAFQIDTQKNLATRLCKLSGMTNVFFCNSGAESVETAIKIARKYGDDQNITMPKILVIENSFHGRTMGAMSATSNKNSHESFGPIIDGLIRVNFNDIDDIKKQFHHLLKIVPKSGNLIYFDDDQNTSDVIKSGLWCNKVMIGSDHIEIDIIHKALTVDNKKYSLKDLPLSGEHNFKNYVCSILAATKGGITIEQSIDSLKKFRGVKRRMDLVADISNTKVYDDFAHHPTAIKMSSNSIKDKYPSKKILGIVELGSNTMSFGYHKDNLIESLKILDKTLLLDINNAYDYLNGFDSEEKMLDCIRTEILEYDIILIMTNKDSQKFIKPILDSLENK